MKPVCMFCGEIERVVVHEVYAGGEFMLDTCCEGQHEIALDELNADPREAARWLDSLPVSDFDDDVSLGEVLGHGAALRRVVDIDCQMRLDWKLEIVEISQAQAKAFIVEHHKHCGAPVGWRYGAGIRNGGQLIGVISVGNPVARGYVGRSIVEVNRLCVRRDIPQELTWNACSQLYGWSAREAKRRGFARIITYTLESEPGTTLRAAGWQVDGQVRARKSGWDTASRPRDSRRTPNVPKTRWARELRA